MSCLVPDLGFPCPHKASSLVKSGHASSGNFLNDLKKDRSQCFRVYLLPTDPTHVVARKGDI